MLNRFATALSVLAIMVLFVNVQADDAPSKDAKKKAEIKCPMSGGKVDMEKAAAYKEGKVYFCCKSCMAAFKKDPTKHAVKANAQLVQTKQYEQTKCPMSGGPLKTESKIAGLTVKFCCKNCKKAADDAKGDDQLALIFSDKAFEKGFAKKKTDDKDGETKKTDS